MSASPKPSNASHTYPEPYIVPPTLPHRNTLILLHGTSTTGPTFASTILSFPIPSPNSSSSSQSNLTTLFPSTKLIFPTGAPRRVEVLDAIANAWFDMHSFEDRTVGEEAQVEGLRESVLYLGDLVRQEVGIVRSEGRGGRVIVAGFSQGTAVGVVGVLSGEFLSLGKGRGEGNEEGEGIVGFVGLSGWLPFRKDLDEVLARIPVSPEDKAEKQRSVMRYIRDRLGLDGAQSGLSVHTEDRTRSLDVQIYLCHGKGDKKMKVEWGWEMAKTLISARMRVWFTEYEELEHWYNEKELEDVVRFLMLAFEKGSMVGRGGKGSE